MDVRNIAGTEAQRFFQLENQSVEQFQFFVIFFRNQFQVVIHHLGLAFLILELQSYFSIFSD